MTTLVVFDLATLRFFRPGPGRVGVRTATGEILAVTDDPGTDSREAALAACDAALAAAKVLRAVDGTCGTHRVAFADLVAGTVAVGALPKTQSYRIGTEVAVPRDGLVATVTDDTVMLGDVACRPSTAGRGSLVAAADAHS